MKLFEEFVLYVSSANLISNNCYFFTTNFIFDNILNFFGILLFFNPRWQQLIAERSNEIRT